MTLKGFPERLNKAIGKADLSIYDICQRSGIGRTTIYNWLNGISCPNIIYLAQLCKVLNVSADYLLFGKKK